MRLGAYPCLLAEGSFARQAYGVPEISERHRHRYEFNREYEQVLTSGGLRIAGQTPDSVYVEICEIPDHPWFLGCQFHPEFKSKPMEPHPLFSAFIGAAHKHRRAARNRLNGIAPSSSHTPIEHASSYRSRARNGGVTSARRDNPADGDIRTASPPQNPAADANRTPSGPAAASTSIWTRCGRRTAGRTRFPGRRPN